MRRLVAVLSAAAAIACSSDVPPGNPYDPATPAERQAKARVTGRLDAAALLSPAGIDVFLRQDGRLVRSAATDSAGAFAFDALTPGDYAVEAAPQGFLSVTVPLALQAGEQVDLGTLSLVPMLGNDAAHITGEAQLGGFGGDAAPVDHGGILVEAVGYAYTAVTASTGAFTLTVPEGTYTLRISHPDYVAATVEGIELGRSQTVSIVPVLLATNPASVAGRALAELADGSFAPLADALVTLDGTSATGLTNATGDFTLDELAPGSYLLRVVKAGYASATVPVLNLAGGEARLLDAPLSLALQRGGLRGSVALADAPADASGAGVEVTGTGRAAVTGSDGAFAFDGLVAGTYELRARRDGYGMQVVGGLAVAAGSTRDVPRITLTRQGGAISIADGTVTRARAVTLVLGAPSAASFRASEDPTFADASLGDTAADGHPYSGPGSSAPFTLSDRDGAHGVHVVFLDAQGNAAAPASASIVLDRLAPAAPSLLVAGGAGFTRSATVPLSLSAQDLPATPGAAVSGLWKMELASSSDFAGSVLVDYNVAHTWSLEAGDGVKAVYARFVDRAGNVSAAAPATITLDTIAPAAPSIALSGGTGAPAGATGSPAVAAALSASDANAGPGGRDLQVRLSSSPGFAGSSWSAYAPSASWLLTPGDGTKTVYAQFMDAAGNQSLVVSDQITLAATPPAAGTIAVAGGAPATSDPVIPVALSATGAAAYRLFVNGLAATAWLPYATSATLDLGTAPDEATRLVSVSYRNVAGLEGGGASTSIVLDRRPPVAPSLAVNGGAQFTGAGTVTLSLSASDAPAAAGGVASGLATVEVANDAAFTASSTFAYATSLSWTLAAGPDGARSVHARFRDHAGNVSAVASASILLDGAGPAGPSISLAGNAEAQAGYSGTPVITATLSATDANEGAGKANLQVRISNDAGFAGASWQPYSAALPWVLPPGDGAKTVYAQFRDAAGNASLPVSAGITLAAAPPSGGSIAVAGGAPATSSTTVPATLSASGASRMCLYVNGAAVTGWILYAASASVDLGAAPDESSRTVSVVFRGPGGVEGATALTSVVLDRTAPIAPSVVVEGGAAFTGSTGVALSLSASDGPTTGTVSSGLATVEVANDPAFTGSSSFPYATSLSWTLAAGVDGARTVYVRFRDGAGNVSPTASDAIALDTNGPAAPSIALAGNPEAQPGYTGTAVVTATLSATDANEGAGKANLQVRLSNDAGFAGASWQPYAASLPWVLNVGDGAKAVYAQFRDAAGNTSLAVSAGITLATSPPSGGSIAVAGGAPATNQATVPATLSASGAAQMRLHVNGAAVTGWIAYAASASVDLGAAPDESTRTVSVVFRGPGGVEGGTALASIVVDRTAPTAPSVVVAGGAAFTGTTAVIVSVSAQDGPSSGTVASGLASVELSNGATFAGSVTFPMADTVAWTLPAGDGSKLVHARFLDKAGNVSAAASDGIVLDTTAPSGPSIALAGNPEAQPGYTGTPVVTLTLSATDANEGAGKANLELRVSNDVGFAGASWQPYTTALQWVLPTGDGTKTVYAQFRDAAGNPSPTASSTIQLLSTPPAGGSIVLAGGAAATSSQVIPVAITAAGAVSMRLSVNGAAVTGWIAYATSTSVDLGASPDEATRVVGVSFQGSGGVEGGAATASVRFDRTPPAAGTLTLAGTLGNGTSSATLTATPAVVLQIAPPGGDEVEMAVAQAATAATPCSSAFGTPLWQPVSRSATLVLTGTDGAKRACVLFRDQAGNSLAASAAAASITLDTTPPTNPEFTNLASRTQSSTSAPTSGRPTVTASTDATGSVTYQCVGGTGSAYGPQWADCGASTLLPTAWTLARNQESTLGIRARDAAYNYSPGSFVRMVHDDVAPFPPFITDLRASRDSVTVTWDATADADVANYLVYYGNAMADFAGTGSAQGPSPVQVIAVSGQVAPSLTLTNLTAGLPYYLAVEALDSAGNRSGPGGQRLAVPSRANPRVLSTFGGQPRTMASATVGTPPTRTLLYLAENQGIVQLDVTADGGVPVVVGRAYVPDLVPDGGGAMAVIACSKGFVTGHCVLPTGTTAEGDYRGDSDTYRASLPIVFFRTSGTAATPAVGTIEGLLPVRPSRVLVGTFAGENVIVTVDRQGVRAFTFKAGQLAFLRQVARQDFSASVLAVYAATLAGSQLHVYARVNPQDDSAPNLWTFDLSGVLGGGIGETRQGPLLDDQGRAIGDVRDPSSVRFVPAFHGGGIFLAYLSALSDQSVLSWYQAGTAFPQETLTLPGAGSGSDGIEPVATAGGVNQNLYVFLSSGLGAPEVHQVLDDGGMTWLSSFDAGGSMSDAVAAHAGVNHAGQERLWAIEASGLNRSLERYTVSGAAIAHLANPFRELPPEVFTESDRFIYVAAGGSIHTVEAANPYTPTVVSTVTRAASSYTKLFTHGRFLYAVGGSTGLDVFRMGGDGTLTYRTTALDATIGDGAVVGRWLFTVSGSGLRAWNAANVGALFPSIPLLTTLAPGVGINGVAARYASSTGGVAPVAQAVIYAVTSGAQLRTYAFNGAALSLLGAASWSGDAATSVSVKGDYAVAGTPGGSYLFSVANPAGPFLTGAAIYPVSGPVQLQNGYLVGLGGIGEASGPAFAGRGAGGVDGAIRYSACNAPQGGADGSFTHVDGRYAASCDRNGITLFTPVTVDGGRLQKTHDITASWSLQGAALASDGMYARLAGPTIPGAGFTDSSRLYTVSEQTTAEGTLSAPFWASTNLQVNPPAGPAGADVPRSASFMVEADGAIFVVTRKVASPPTVDAYDPGTTPWVYLGRVSLAGAAEPAAVASDGDYLYVARNGAQGAVDVVDIRNPLSPAVVTTWPGVAANYHIASLALARDRLYAGMAQGIVELNEVRVLDVSAVQASSSVTAKTTLQIGVEGGITGVAVVGKTLFYTQYDPVYQVPTWSVGAFRLGTADRDGGAGAASIARLAVTSPAQAPIVAGDVLYVASNLGTASFDLAPCWREGLPPAPVGGVNLADPFRGGPVTMRIDGPFASMVGGTYRVFDLR